MIAVGSALRPSVPPSLGLALAVAAAAAPIQAQQGRPPIPTPLSSSGACPTSPTLKAAQGGGTFVLGGDEPVRIPYGVHYTFRHRIPDAEAVLLELEIEGERTRLRGAAGPAPANGCYEARLPELPRDRPITLTETVVKAPTKGAADSAAAAIDKLRDEFLRSLMKGDWAVPAAEQRIPEAIAADFGRLTDTLALKDLALVADGGERVVSLADSVRRLFESDPTELLSVPDRIVGGQALLSDLDLAVAGGGICNAAPAGAETIAARKRLARLQTRLAALRDVEDADGIVAAAAKSLPLSGFPPDTVAGWVRTACAGATKALLDTLASDVANLVTALSEGPLRRFYDLVAAARTALRNSYRITAVDVFGGFTTTLQRFAQLDVVNAYLFGREEARLLATFSFYPLRTRYGAERQPYSFADLLVLSVGYSLARTVSGEDAGDDEGGAVTVGAGLRVNETLGVGAGGAFMDGDSFWYLSLSFDLGSIPGLENVFARE